jgi:YbbR domain-containing protein
VHPTQVSVTTKFSVAPEEKILFVQAVFDNAKLPVGFTIKDYSVQPQTVTATGSSASLGKLSSVKTEKIDLSKLTGSQTLIVPLKSLGGNVRLRPSSVGVTVNLQPITLNSLSPRLRSNRSNDAPSVPGAPR